MSSQKPDADRIRAKLKALEGMPNVKSWWPRYLYHFAELQNAVSILEAGALHCRDHRSMKVDTASPLVLDRTEARWQQFVRLYFRPRTPTQYQVEGFRPASQLGSLQKHCPMLFVFMFRAAELLTLKTTEFSKGNLAAHPEVGSDADYFEAIPFNLVYHDIAMPEGDKSKIKFHRCAEALIPGQLGLDNLRYVWCRSPAEHHTLINSLSAKTRAKYRGKFGVGAQADVHFRRWTFIEEATLEQNQAALQFNPSTTTPGPFRANAMITAKGQTLRWSDDEFTANSRTKFRFAKLGSDVDYELKFELDGATAYLGKYHSAKSSMV